MAVTDLADPMVGEEAEMATHDSGEGDPVNSRTHLPDRRSHSLGDGCVERVGKRVRITKKNSKGERNKLKGRKMRRR